MNTFDIVILVVLAAGGLIGFQKGLITGLARFIGKIAAIAIAVIFHKQFYSIVEPIFGVRAMVEPTINSFLAGAIEKQIPADTQIPNKDAILQPVLGEATLALTDYVLNIGSLIVLFIVAILVINFFIAIAIKPIAKSLGVINRGGGFAFGFLSTLVVICLIVGLITPVLTATPMGITNINNSTLYPFVNDGYAVLKEFISVFSANSFTNPWENIPILKGTFI